MQKTMRISCQVSANHFSPVVFKVPVNDEGNFDEVFVWQNLASQVSSKGSVS